MNEDSLGAWSVPELPPCASVFAIVAALFGAVKFTGWYPEAFSARPALGDRGQAE